MNTLEPSTKLTVILEAATWNAIIAAMGKARYERVAPLIEAIGAQLRQQSESLQPPVPPHVHNGQDAQL